MDKKLMFSSKSNEWETPQWLFDKLNNRYNFTLDAAATKDNAKCKKFYTKEDNALSKSWQGETVFLNPPYGREIKDWVEKAHKENKKGNCKVVMLIPARTDTIYWHNYIFGKADIEFLKGRLKFSNHKNPAPFPSAVVIYG